MPLQIIVWRKGHAAASNIGSMARNCQRNGYAWSMVTDHSGGLEVASGLDAEGLRLQRKRIDRFNARSGEDHRIFQGLEVEVLEDGALDVPHGERILNVMHADELEVWLGDR